MKNIIIVLFATLLFTACSEEKKDIEFKKMVNVHLGNLEKENAKLNATAIFMNLSDQEYDLKDMTLDFTIDGKDVGTVVTKISKKIKANSEFSIPIQYTYETSAIIEEGHDPSTTYAIQLLGNLTVKNTSGEEISAPVKFASTYEFLTKKEERIEQRKDKKEERKSKHQTILLYRFSQRIFHEKVF